jgi:hypothetical protein
MAVSCGGPSKTSPCGCLQVKLTFVERLRVNREYHEEMMKNHNLRVLRILRELRGDQNTHGAVAVGDTFEFLRASFKSFLTQPISDMVITSFPGERVRAPRVMRQPSVIGRFLW